MFDFDRKSLGRRLENIPARSRTLFALACSERLLPIYSVFCVISERGDWEYIQSESDRLWHDLTKGIICPNHEFLDAYPTLAPGDDIPRSQRTLLDPLAENAVLALGSAWECHLSGEANKAMWAAEQAYEAMDYMAQNVRGIDYRTTDGEAELLESPFVQTELKQQNDDLTTLEDVSEMNSDFVRLVIEFRKRAETVGETLKQLVGPLLKRVG